jgi:hypothetical protein
MPSLSYTLKAKGFRKTVKRATSMINWYGFSSKRMERNIVDFVNLLVEYDAKATFAITANMKHLILGSKEYPMGTNKGEDPLPSGGIEIYTGNLVEFFMEKG